MAIVNGISRGIVNLLSEALKDYITSPTRQEYIQAKFDESSGTDFAPQITAIIIDTLTNATLFAIPFTKSDIGFIRAIDPSGYVSDDRKVVYEKYRVEPIQLEPREDIPFARIALYEDSESAIAPINDYRANMGEQVYLIDVSVLRAYSGDKANRGELLALNICDTVKEWSKQANFSELTGEYLYSFRYQSSSRFLRNDKYTTRTLTFVGKRDLYKEQLVPLGSGFPYTFNFILT